MVSIWLTVAAFAGAGLVNAIARPVQQESFVRWGYPAWWCRATGILELVVALLIAVPAGRTIGLAVGAAIIAVAAVTVARHREPSHLVPIGLYVALLVLVATTA